ncbi:ABC transporter permease [Streptomyces sp. NPDC026673]|uniref:ABC transporter permease n=1 Tax=Streptomyces sp. NPDC026673 TaxID=3155724 RepID=UPI0033DCE8D2
MQTTSPPLTPFRLRPRDVLRVGGTGLRYRPVRAVLSALGIAIGIAAMTAVVGISSSSRTALDRELAALGTNLLTVGPGKDHGTGQRVALPETAPAMIRRVGPVQSVAAVARLPRANVYRNEHIPTALSGSIAVYAATQGLPEALRVSLAVGDWPNAAQAKLPVVVLGAGTANTLGIHELRGASAAEGPNGVQVVLDGSRFTVVGILAPAALAPELDRAALVGWEAARTELGFDGHPTTVYARVRDDAVTDVHGVLAPTANPEHPELVAVSRPSDALVAKNASERAFTGLLLGLGSVALLVGGIGVANTMVISVLERRTEIGLRRALGATQGQIRLQFLAESLLLSALGGVAGVLLGILVTGVYATTQGWPTTVPVWASAGGTTATLAIGGLAGLYPSVRAARMSPTEALAGT